MSLQRPLNGIPSIIGATRTNHSRYRRLLSHAFSDKGIREQSPIIRQYVDLLIQRLHERAGKGSQDMADWYTWTTFDLIGDLAFGESFNCLRDVATHPWIAAIFGNIKAIPFINAFYRYGLSSLVGFLAPKRMLKSRKDNYEYSVTKVEQRLASEGERGDFWDKILIHSKEESGTGMTRDEMVSNASLLVLAGSETTATLLSGATYLLLKHPAVMAKLVTEIRTAFKSDDEIDIFTVGKLEYMLAVLDETMRLYPPVASQLNRVTPRGGETVCGNYVAEGVGLTLNPYRRLHQTNESTRQALQCSNMPPITSNRTFIVPTNSCPSVGWVTLSSRMTTGQSCNHFQLAPGTVSDATWRMLRCVSFSQK